MKRLIICILSLIVWEGQAVCPSLCTCKSSKVGESLPVSELGPGEFMKIKCGSVDSQISEIKEIDFSKVLATTLSL